LAYFFAFERLFDFLILHVAIEYALKTLFLLFQNYTHLPIRSSLDIKSLYSNSGILLKPRSKSKDNSITCTVPLIGRENLRFFIDETLEYVSYSSIF